VLSHHLNYPLIVMNVRNTTTVFFLTKTSHTRTHTLQNMRIRLRTRKRSERGEQAARGMVVAVRGEAALRERVRPNVQKVRHQTVHLFFLLCSLHLMTNRITF